MDFTWLTQERRLAPPALTVRAQTISPNDNGLLRWDTYFPRVNVESVDLSEITTLDDRPVADRRDWNGPGRLIPIMIPALRDLEIVPIEAYDLIGEKEIQKLNEQTQGNQDVIRNLIGVKIPARGQRLAGACYRRHEMDSFEAWGKGTVTVRNPQDASKTYTVSLGFSSSRLLTAATAWNDNSVNAYTLFLAFLSQAIDAVGGIEGAMLHLATLNAIQADAPTLMGGAQMTRAQLADRIAQDLAQPFRFDIIENSLDVFNDGGTGKTRTKVWPAGYVAAIPAGGTVGSSYFAPVARAWDIAATAPGAGIDVNGVSVFYVDRNGGKGLEIQAQLNSLAVPEEQRIYVINAGV